MEFIHWFCLLRVYFFSARSSLPMGSVVLFFCTTPAMTRPHQKFACSCREELKGARSQPASVRNFLVFSSPNPLPESCCLNAPVLWCPWQFVCSRGLVELLSRPFRPFFSDIYFSLIHYHSLDPRPKNAPPPFSQTQLHFPPLPFLSYFFPGSPSSSHRGVLRPRESAPRMA